MKGKAKDVAHVQMYKLRIGNVQSRIKVCVRQMKRGYRCFLPIPTILNNKKMTEQPRIFS